MQFLRANTQVKVVIGPVVAVGDGFTPVTTLALNSADEAELLKHDAGSVTDISAATFAAITSADGYYNLTLTTSHTDTEGLLTVLINDDSLCLPVKQTFMVLAEAAYDSLFVAKDDGFMDVNIKTIGRADTQETEASNLETACANYSETRGLSGTALPAAAADAAGGLPISDAGGLDLDTQLGKLVGTIASGTHNPQSGDAYAIVNSGTHGNAALKTLIDAVGGYVDTEVAAIVSELAKVPKSDGTATWNATALASIQSECNDALVAYDPPTKAELDTAVANVSVEEIQATAIADLFNTNSGTTYASAVAGSAVKEIADNAGGASLTVGDIADAVWDEALSGHATGGSAGKTLADVLVDTAEIGAAGAGLTELAKASKLQRYVSLLARSDLAVGSDLNTELGEINNDYGSGGGNYGAITDSHQAIRDRGDSAWITATGFSTLTQADVRTAVGLASANLDTQLGTIDTNVDSVLEDTGTTLPATLSTIAGYLDTEVAAILADTNELQTDWANGGRLDVLIDAIKAKTDNLPASPAATGDIPTVAQIWTTALTEAYRSTGATGTATQLLYEILQNLKEFSIAGTTKTVKKLDGSTTAKTYTLDDATNPTAITEAT